MTLSRPQVARWKDPNGLDVLRLPLQSLYMPKEQEGIPLTAIHINLEDNRIEFEDSHGTIATVSFPALGTIYFDEGRPERSVSGASAPEERERAQTVTLTGRLRTEPRQGRPDRSGNPTAYARFSAHREGEEGPHDYIATFHRHTVQIALGLRRDAQIAVEGYPHPSGSDRRQDTFSVINILNDGRATERRQRR